MDEKVMNNNRPIILFLDHTPFIGGAQSSLIKHLENIDKNKFRIKIACSEKAIGSGLVEEYKRLGLEYQIINFPRLKTFGPLLPLRFIRGVHSLANITKRNKADLIVTNTVRTAIFGSIAAWWHKIPSIWFIRDFTFPLFLFKILSLLPEKIIFNSKATANYYKQYLNSDMQAAVVYSCRDTYKKIKNIDKNEIIELRREWKATDKLVIGYVGRLVESKGPQILIEAINRMDDEYRNKFKCVIVGTGENQSGNNERDLHRIVNDLNLDEIIIFLGYRRDIEALLSAFDIFVLTSIEPESLPATVVDAMMAGVPVIGTDSGGTAEIISNNRTGLLLRPNDPRELRRAISTMADDRSLAALLSENAYNRAMKHHSCEVVTVLLERIYSDVLGI